MNVAAASPAGTTLPAAPVPAPFEPYGRLLQMLMPSLIGVVVHDSASVLLWKSEELFGAEITSIDELAAETARAGAAAQDESDAALHRTLDADRSAYVFGLRGAAREMLGTVTLLTRPASSQAADRPLTYVQPLVSPVLECIKREMQLRASIDLRERDIEVRERDMSMMLQMTQKSAADEVEDFEQIFTAAIDHLGCASAALWVPERKISMYRARLGESMSAEALARTEKHLLVWMQLQQRVMVINRVASARSSTQRNPDLPHKILACPVRNPAERVIGVLVMFNSSGAADFDARQTRIAELLAKKAASLIQAQYDSGTGLMMRQAFEKNATNLLAAAEAHESHAIVYLDIDRLHVINETFGMHTGDEVIAAVAEAMAKELPPGALSVRISGDRMAALLPATSLEQVGKIAERIRAATAAITPRHEQGPFEVSVCLGVAPVVRSDSALVHALATAEAACKAAKDRGRNRVELFQDSDQSIIRRHSDILVIGDLRDALQSDRFRLDAQPILPLASGRGRPHFELLLRMIGEKGEVIPPGKFLSSAERYQMMPTIDRWVVEHACRELGRHGSALRQDVACFAINLSGQSLRDEGFLEFVTGQIEASRLPPGALCFELTETATMGNLEHAQAFMRHLQERGCQFSLDDFGTGVSSLAYLKALSVHYLKIDGSFVRDVIGNPRSESMIKAIAQLAKAMGMETIAEYVETDALRVRMADLGVDYGQGFAIGKPQPLATLLQDLAVYELA